MRILALLVSGVCLFPFAAIAAPGDVGLFAVFNTNHGSFTCELFYEQAPVTVANFVGLTEGSRAWIDPESGTVERRPFYDGLTFHRVINNFMIQGGSPNGLGTDGPGYRFPDEFQPGLVHGRKGMLSMANSGIDTNGSQFFITLAPTSWLDYKHAVFGEVVFGMEVVEAIGLVETGTNSRPVEPVVIESVTIVRNGAAAEAFNPEIQELPVVREVRSRIESDGNGIGVRFHRESGREFKLSYSDDLQSWNRSNIAPAGAAGEEAVFDVTELAGDRDRQFYRVAEVDNNPVREAYVPENIVGKTLDLDMVSAGLRIVLYPDKERTEENEGESLGTGDLNGDTGRDLDYLWFREKSRGVIFFRLEGYVQFDLHLLFVDEETGTFSGIAHTANRPTVNGTFTLHDQAAAGM